MTTTPTYTVPAATRIGHVHLKVANLQRALDFYVGLLGFDLVMRFGEQAAFVSAGGYHHHIGLNTRESKDAPPPPRHSTGLYHVAILYPTRADLAAIAQRVIDAGIHIGASHHGVSEAIYLTDPDGNGIELYRDLPQDQRPRDANGNIQMVTEYLDVTGLIESTL